MKIKENKLPAGSKKPFNVKLLLFLILGCLISGLVYFALVSLSELSMEITTVAFMVMAGAIAVIYVIYNKGTLADRISPEQLPSSMSNNEKAEFFEKAAERKARSKWLIALFFILLFPLALDLMKLFVIDEIFPGLADKWFS